MDHHRRRGLHPLGRKIRRLRSRTGLADSCRPRFFRMGARITYHNFAHLCAGRRPRHRRRLDPSGCKRPGRKKIGVSMNRAKKRDDLPACAVLLAGGRGTRFWPRSRTSTPKQLLNITGGETMLRETVTRLTPVFSEQNCWVVTNAEQASAVRRELPRVPRSQVLTEPVGRNTAAAIALAAIHLAHQHGDALMAVLSSDAHITDVAKYRSLLRVAL